jgi:hypothetical protein
MQRGESFERSDCGSFEQREYGLSSFRVAVIITAMFALLDFACPTIGTGGQANN